MEFYNVDHSSAGLVSTFFFFAYGIGQVINGLFCKKYNLKWIVFGSLVISGVANFIVGFSNNFVLIKYLWLLNGFSMSILWPSLIRLLSESLSKKDMTKATLAMGTTVATGTFLVYGLSAIFAKINFKIIFYIASVLFAVVSCVWIFSFSGLVKKVCASCKEDEIKLTATQTTEHSEKFNKSILLLSIVLLGVYGVATNLVKDGLTTWVPSILKEQYYLDSSFSIILTLFLPVVSIFGNAFAVMIHKKIPDYVLQCAMVFSCAGAVLGGVITCVSLNQFWLTLIGFTIVCFLVSSCNSLITSIFPLFMKGKINSGLLAGILNGCCNLGSMLASYVLGEVADSFGWITVFWVLLFVCIFIVIAGGIYLFIRRFLKQKGI
jgi:OPA family glycerol-3-phosphate transporter-like MFS transporter